MKILLWLFLFPWALMAANKDNNYMKKDKWDPKFLEAFDKEFVERIEEDKVPGAIYIIVNNNRRVKERAYGVRKIGKKKPVDIDTVFRMASLSKTFSGVLAAKLVEQKLINLDAKVIDFIPGFRFKNKGASDKLTIRHILSHSTGMIHNAYDKLLHRRRLTLEKILAEFKHIKSICDPGGCYGYQNVLFSMIDPIVEFVQKKKFADVMTEQLFEPLKFQHASIGVEAYDKVVNVAAPHVWNKGANEWESVMVQEAFYKTQPASGINASAGDLEIWINAMLGHYPKVVSPEVIEQVTSKITRTKKELKRRYWKSYLFDAHYGLGWRVYRFGGYDLFYHAGWLEGYRVSLSFSKEKDIGLIILMNAESESISYLEAEFWRQIHNFPAR
jgi:beta-lactamase class C